jgi:putative oxidoreductase
MTSSTVTDRYAGPALSLLRIVAAIIYLPHGLQKAFGMFDAHPVQNYATIQGAALFIECIFGVLILIGLFTRISAFIASGEMAVAFFLFHVPRGFLPIVNHGETPVLLCFVFLYIAVAGPGPFSVDALLARRSSSLKM